MGAWAVRSPSFLPDAPVGADSVILALGTFFDADAADDLSASYQLRLGVNAFNVRVADRAIEVDRGAGDDPDAIIETDPATLSALIWNSRELPDALHAGDIAIDGNQRRDPLPRALTTIPTSRPSSVGADGPARDARHHEPADRGGDRGSHALRAG